MPVSKTIVTGSDVSEGLELAPVGDEDDFLDPEMLSLDSDFPEDEFSLESDDDFGQFDIEADDEGDFLPDF